MENGRPSLAPPPAQEGLLAGTPEGRAALEAAEALANRIRARGGEVSAQVLPLLLRAEGFLVAWGVIFAASAILQACDQAPPGRGGEPPRQRETQAEVERLRDFVDLLHREIEQLQKDKQRLTEEAERLQRDNAALRARTVNPAAATRRAARPARGASPE